MLLQHIRGLLFFLCVVLIITIPRLRLDLQQGECCLSYPLVLHRSSVSRPGYIYLSRSPSYPSSPFLSSVPAYSKGCITHRLHELGLDLIGACYSLDYSDFSLSLLYLRLTQLSAPQSCLVFQFNHGKDFHQRRGCVTQQV